MWKHEVCSEGTRTIQRSVAAVFASVLFSWALALPGVADDAIEPPEETEEASLPFEDNVTLNVLGLVIGGLDVGYAHTLTEHITVGAELTFIPPLVVDVYGIGVGANAYWWTSTPHDGYFLGPRIGFTHIISDDTTGRKRIRDGTLFDVGILLGHRWLWDSGFNMGLGAGAGYAVVLDRESCPSGFKCETERDGLALRLVFDLGWAF